MSNTMSNSDINLPNFIIVGAYKGATTALAKRLSEHPEVFFSTTKETHYFAEDELYRKGLDWYRQFFGGSQDQKAIGEASPTYTRSKRYPEAAKRISRDIADVKIIYILRDPIVRMESQWIEGRRGGWAIPPFNEAVVSEETDLFETSCYWNELEQYRKYFPDERILILFTEDFFSSQNQVLKDCYEFLDIDANYRNPNEGALVRPSHGATIDKDWVSRYVRAGVGKFVLKFIPKRIINLLRPLGRSKVIDRPTWEPQLLRNTIADLQQDTKRILEYAGKPENFWELKKHIKDVE